MANRLACALLERTGKELAGQPLHNFVQEVESPEVGLVADEEEKEDGEEKFTRIVSTVVYSTSVQYLRYGKSWHQG